MSDITDTPAAGTLPGWIVKKAEQVLRDEGGQPGNNLHSWRCEHPETYGECDCTQVVTQMMLEAVADDIRTSPAAENTSTGSKVPLSWIENTIHMLDGSPWESAEAENLRVPLALNALEAAVKAIGNHYDNHLVRETKRGRASTPCVCDICNAMRAIKSALALEPATPSND